MARLHFPSILNHDKKLISVIDCSYLYIHGSAQNVVHNVLMLITHLIKKNKNRTTMWAVIMTFGEEQYEMIWCIKEKDKGLDIKLCRPT